MFKIFNLKNMEDYKNAFAGNEDMFFAAKKHITKQVTNKILKYALRSIYVKRYVSHATNTFKIELAYFYRYFKYPEGSIITEDPLTKIIKNEISKYFEDVEDVEKDRLFRRFVKYNYRGAAEFAKSHITTGYLHLDKERRVALDKYIIQQVEESYNKTFENGGK